MFIQTLCRRLIRCLHCQLGQVGTAWGFQLVQGATLDPLHLPTVSCDAPQSLTKLLPKPFRSREKHAVPFFYLLLMRKCCFDESATIAASTLQLLCFTSLQWLRIAIACSFSTDWSCTTETGCKQYRLESFSRWIWESAHLKSPADEQRAEFTGVECTPMHVNTDYKSRDKYFHNLVHYHKSCYIKTVFQCSIFN